MIARANKVLFKDMLGNIVFGLSICKINTIFTPPSRSDPASPKNTFFSFLEAISFDRIE